MIADDTSQVRRTPPDPSLPGRFREFHVRLPLAGDPPNALLSLPDDRILYLPAVLGETLVPAPSFSRPTCHVAGRVLRRRCPQTAL